MSRPRTSLVLAVLAALAGLTLAACEQKPAVSPSASASASAPSAPDAKAAAPAGSSILDTVAAQASGFSVGPMMASRTVYVFFDPQCPHCGRLWEASKPVVDKLRMMWIPVGILNPNSAPQGAALLAASDAVATMNRHEAEIAAGRSGLVPPAKPAPELLDKVKANTQLWKTVGAESVPFMLYRNPASGQIANFAGAADTATLKQMFGL